MSESIVARIVRVRHCAPSKHSKAGVNFVIASTDLGITVKGEMRKPIEGQQYRFDGESRYDFKYKETQFIFDRHEPVIDASIDGIATFLANHIDGLGPRKSQALTEMFGEQTIEVLRETPELAANVRGITEAVVESIRRYFAANPKVDPAAYAALVELFADTRFPKYLVQRLLKDWQSDAAQVVTENPYLLLSYPRMGWKGVDAFALTRVSYAVNGRKRQQAAILEAFAQHSAEGHTYASGSEIESIVFMLIGMNPDQSAWLELIRDGDVNLLSENGNDDWLDLVCEELRSQESGEDDHKSDTLWGTIGWPRSLVVLPKLDAAERSIADQIARLSAYALRLPIELSGDGLNEAQQKAVRMMNKKGICILAGCPGTGKSYTVAAVIGQLAGKVPMIRVVAPTGKAAKRAQELVDGSLGRSEATKHLIGSIKCTTIHRALGPVPSEEPEGVPQDSAKVGRGRDGFTFTFNSINRMAVDVIFIDETSMVDTMLMSSLLEALPDGCRVVFVGDQNQLPSVQAGAVFRDLMRSGLPVVELTDIVRSDGGGTVVRACHAIKDGREPEASNDVELPTKNWVHLEAEGAWDTAQLIADLIESAKNNGNYDAFWDVQVISPQHRSEAIGCGPLNRRLADLLNPKAENEGAISEDEGFGPQFRIGDKVIRTKNGVCDLMTRVYDRDARADLMWQDNQDPDDSFVQHAYKLSETDIVNGDMGTVLDIFPDKDNVSVVVRFRNPDRLCRLAYSSCELTAAYAVTVHKAQGSGFPYVIMPVSLDFYWNPRKQMGLWCRELFYTAISRTEQVLVTVGPWAAIAAVVMRPTLHQRRTRLIPRVKAALAGREGSEVKQIEQAKVEAISDV